jgi:hypothetical protein
MNENAFLDSGTDAVNITVNGSQLTAEQMAQYQDLASGAGLGGFMALFAAMWIFILAIYIYSAICYMAVAKRTNTPNGWFAFIPVLNMILMLQIAKRPLWWIILMILPIVNIVIAIIILVDILKVLRRPAWWVILMLIPIVNLVILGVMAWGKTDAPMVGTTPPPVAPTQPMA